DLDQGDLDAIAQVWRPIPEREAKFAVHVTPDGKKHIIEIKDPEMVKAVNALDSQTIEWWAKLLQPFSRTLHLGVSSSPVFAVRHGLRNSFFAASMSDYLDPGHYMAGIVKGVVDLAGGAPIGKEAL